MVRELPNLEKVSVVSCRHCGAALSLNDTIGFCCSGCEAVYTIIRENGLGTYYDISDHPGVSLRNPPPAADYSILDQEKFLKRFCRGARNGELTARFTLPQIHCAACVWLLEKIPAIEPAVREVRVNYLRREAAITFDPLKIPLSRVAAYLAGLGYSPDLQSRSESKRASSESRGYLLRLAVAGFAFGNMMLFSLPEYFAAKLDLHFTWTFRFLNLSLSLPVLFYSALPFFRNFFTALKTRSVNLDVPIVLGILSMYGLSLYELFSASGPGYFDTFAGLVFFLSIGRYIQSRSIDTLQFDRDYRSFFPLSALRLSPQNGEMQTDISQLRHGDEIRVRNGEIIPADCSLLSASAVLDHAFVTGEDFPQTHFAGEKIPAGTKVVGKSARLRVENSVNQGSLARLWEISEKQIRSGAAISSTVTRLSPYFTYTILGIAVASFLFWLPDVPRAMAALSGVLIIACPCALAMATPFTLGNAMNILSRSGFFVKNTGILENFFRIKNVVFDKTGTLTACEEFEVSFFAGPANTTDIGIWRSLFTESAHPLARAIAASLPSAATSYSPQVFTEIAGSGVRGTFAGKEYLAGSLKFLSESRVKGLPKASPSTENEVHLASDGSWAGFFSIKSQPRPGIFTVLKNLRKKYSLFLISGDKFRNQTAVVRHFPATNIHFEVTAAEKMLFIENISTTGPALMIGDGLNDAGALLKADIGIAITENTGSFTPASDVIMHAKLLSHFDQVLNFIRSTRAIIWLNLVISFGYNAVGLAVAVRGDLSPLFCAIIMPLSSLTVIATSTAAVRIAALLNGARQWK